MKTSMKGAPTLFKSAFLSFSLFLFPLLADAQIQPHNPVFDDTHVPRITILIDQPALDQILAPGNALSDEEFPATFIFQSPAVSDTVTNVGFRLRGNTSRVSQKKSFKVSFNTFEMGRKFYGLEKLNLNGEHNDPSIIRSKLSWDLFAAMGLPATRANHVEVYINDEYRGLYINVEHIDEQFLKSRFGNDAGNLYKCLYPADLAYRGPDGDDYNYLSGDRRPYDLKLKDSDAGAYDDLAQFISVLTIADDIDFANTIESVFDVNSYLQMLAIEVATGSWDGYWFLKNNFYLYANPETQLIHFIPYDYDNTFGIDFVNQDWGTRDVYNWGHPSEVRPLTTRLLNIDTYRDRFTFYLRRLIDEEFNPERLFPRIDRLFDMILPAAEMDTYRTLDYGYDIDTFTSSYTLAPGNHVPYGLKPYIQTRFDNVVVQLEDNTDVRPIIDEQSVRAVPERPAEADPIAFTAFIEDESKDLNVILEYRLNEQPWESISLSDDGMTGDAAASDGIYSGEIPALLAPGTLSYIVSAQDPGRQTSFSRTRTLEIGFPRVSLHINELMASNSTTLADEAGEFDDWVELFNSGLIPIALKGKFLTDNLNRPDKWPLPDATVNAGEFLVLWLDNHTDQGALHAPFKLSAGGEQLGLFGQDASGFYPIDTLSFASQPTDQAFARLVDGAGAFALTSQPTPGGPNQSRVDTEAKTPVLISGLGRPYPNPFQQQVVLWVNMAQNEPIRVEVFDILGKNVNTLWNGPLHRGRHKMTWTGQNREGRLVPAGVYFFKMHQFDTGGYAMQKAVYLPQ